MDEPLSALDDKTRSKMQRLILDVHAETGNTIIMVTHSQDEAFKMCDKIIKFETTGWRDYPGGGQYQCPQLLRLWTGAVC